MTENGTSATGTYTLSKITGAGTILSETGDSILGDYSRTFGVYETSSSNEGNTHPGNGSSTFAENLFDSRRRWPTPPPAAARVP